MKAPAFYSTSRRSFTLVEMLAAIAVLAILMVILGAILGSTSKIADASGRTNDSALEARQVLDRIGVDFSSMLIRPDVDQFVSKATGSDGNDQMFFYSQQAGYFASSATTTQQSPMSLIGYRISTSANTSVPPVLQRLAKGLTWEGTSGMNYLTFLAPTSVTNTPTVNSATQIATQWTSMVNDPDTSETFWHEVGSQVFRFEVCYQLQNGSFTTNCPTYSNSGSITNTVAMVVAIAVLDSKSRKLISNSSQWTSLIAALPDPTPTDLTSSPPVLMSTTWNNALQSTTFPATAGISTMAASHIKVYQRYYYLNAPKFQ